MSPTSRRFSVSTALPELQNIRWPIWTKDLSVPHMFFKTNFKSTVNLKCFVRRSVLVFALPRRVTLCWQPYIDLIVAQLKLHIHSSSWFLNCPFILSSGHEAHALVPQGQAGGARARLIHISFPCSPMSVSLTDCLGSKVFTVIKSDINGNITARHLSLIVTIKLKVCVLLTYTFFYLFRK